MAARVVIHVGGHCVETGAKRELNRLMDAYFDGEGDPADLEESIGLVREFLESADFSALRSSDERLDGSVESRVELGRDSSGNPSLKIL